MTDITKITCELLKSWGPCKDGYKRFCELFPDGADLKTAMNGLINDGHDDWSLWLFEKSRELNLFNDITDKGYRNSGNRNSGNRNSGDCNSGNRNSGDCNSGYGNSGDCNSGDRNSGYGNSGDRNSGDWNSGYGNSGDRNSGDWNSGDRNSGDWNSGYGNSGYFNSKTPDEILVFNKICKKSDWDNAIKPDFISNIELTYWVSEEIMSKDDKIAGPYFYVRGGQLRTRTYIEAWKYAWDNADNKNRMLIKNLPNFDADVFFEITGIDLRGDPK